MPSDMRLRILSTGEAQAAMAGRTGLRRKLQSDPETASSVNAILQDVQTEGDRALIKYASRFDNVDLDPGTLRVSREEIENAGKELPAEIRDALRTAAERIESFHAMQTERSWFRTGDGELLGQAVNPVGSAGLYIPGGKALYPSTLLMNAIPARIAGVPRRVLCTPSRNGLKLSPAILYAAGLCGIEEIYRIGGAHAIGALALGTESIAPVDVITGPGNKYVAEAKRQVFGLVAIDMIAGPSEIMIITDIEPDPVQIVNDMFAQAEHDEDAAAILITTSREYAERIVRTASEHLGSATRPEVIRASLENNGMVIVTENLEEAFILANSYAPEHLEVISSVSFERITSEVRNAGAIFIGPWTPESLGDYTAGPNHTLPTAGTARFSSPLGVYDFQKRTSLLSFSREGMNRIGGATAAIADFEGLQSHAESVRYRMEKGD